MARTVGYKKIENALVSAINSEFIPKKHHETAYQWNDVRTNVYKLIRSTWTPLNFTTTAQLKIGRKVIKKNCMRSVGTFLINSHKSSNNFKRISRNIDKKFTSIIFEESEKWIEQRNCFLKHPVKKTPVVGHDIVNEKENDHDIVHDKDDIVSEKENDHDIVNEKNDIEKENDDIVNENDDIVHNIISEKDDHRISRHEITECIEEILIDRWRQFSSISVKSLVKRVSILEILLEKTRQKLKTTRNLMKDFKRRKLNK